MPQISVILPVYNGEKYLKSSIESVLDQTFKDFELIIIDDCSTDASANIAKHYVALDSRISYERNDKNLKLPSSLNKGFSKAIGEYWTWTSCDNIYLPNALEKMLSVLSNNQDIGLVYSDMELIDEHGKNNGLIYAGPADHLIFRNVVGACFLYRRSIAKQIGFYDPTLFLCEDYEYWLRIARTAKIHPMKDCLYQYRNHKNSLSQQHQKDIISKGIAVQKQYYPDFVKTRKQSAIFYAHMRDRDIYNSFRQFYLLLVLFYNPKIFLKELKGLITRRFIK